MIYNLFSPNLIRGEYKIRGRGAGCIILIASVIKPSLCTITIKGLFLVLPHPTFAPAHCNSEYHLKGILLVFHSIEFKTIDKPSLLTSTLQSFFPERLNLATWLDVAVPLIMPPLTLLGFLFWYFESLHVFIRASLTLVLVLFSCSIVPHSFGGVFWNGQKWGQSSLGSNSKEPQDLFCYSSIFTNGFRSWGQGL